MKILLPIVLTFLTSTADAATVLLDTTTINFSASGSTNNAIGSWSSNPLVIPDSTAVDYFTLEVIELKSSTDTPLSGLPLGMEFLSYLEGNSRSLPFCWRTDVCAADTAPGSTGIIDRYSTVTHAWDFLSRLVVGNSPQINGGSMHADWSFSAQRSITGMILVNAYGESPDPVPTPAAVWLFGSGFLGLIGLARRKA